MKLKLRRGQNVSMMGKVTFTLDVRSELTDAEAGYVAKYRLGKQLIYHQSRVDLSNVDDMGSVRRVTRLLAATMLDLKITVDSLTGGQHIECKDILEMLGAETQIKEACQIFKNVLESAAHFEGEEVVAF